MTQDRRLKGAELGTLTHYLMQIIDFWMEPTRAALDGWIGKLVREGYLTVEEGASVNRQWMLGFLASPICGRIRTSERVIREGAFKLMIPAAEAGYASAGEGGRILLQGIVDCMFMEDGAWVLLDYKTDHIESGKEAGLAEKYGIQLQWYKRAIESTTGIPVKEKLLFVMRTGTELLLLG